MLNHRIVIKHMKQPGEEMDLRIGQTNITLSEIQNFEIEKMKNLDTAGKT